MTTTDQPTLTEGEHEAMLHQLEGWTHRAERAEELVARQRAEIAMLKADLGTIASKLRDEAINRDWCGEYGAFVDECNGETSQPWLAHCEFSYTAQFTVHVSFTTRTRAYHDAVGEIAGSIQEASAGDYGNVGSVTANLLRVDEDED